MSLDADDSLVSWEEIRDVELVIRRRMQELTGGIHPSLVHGPGHDLAGLRNWEPGDRPSAIDWAQSTLTNFSPLMTREFDQESSAAVIIAADVSDSTRCGAGGESIARVIAHTVATFALAAAFFQDRAGLVTFDRDVRRIAVRPQPGRNHAIHCVDVYQDQLLGRYGAEPALHRTFAELLRRRSLVPVISDFLFDDTDAFLTELADLNSAHDVFVVLIDSAFAFELPPLSAGWIEAADAETGRTRMLAADDVRQLARRIGEWQDAVEHQARDRGLDVLRLGGAGRHFHDTVVAFLMERKQMKRR